MKKNILVALTFIFVQIFCLQGIGFSATTNIINQGDGWAYTVLNFDLWSNWTNVTVNSFDWDNPDSLWYSARAPFGSASTYNTTWNDNTDLALYKYVDINGTINGDVTLNVAVDNGFIVFINGVEAARDNAEGFTSYWEYQISLSSSLFKQGQNLIQVFTEDHGGPCFFDMQMTADIEPTVTAPLHNEFDSIMTTADYSNFSIIEYFNSKYHCNHNGTDLALSTNGNLTGSQITATVRGHIVNTHAICDGKIINWNYNKNDPDLCYMQVHHPSCGGEDVIAYYGHIKPNPSFKKPIPSDPTTYVTIYRDDILGTVIPYNPISWSHVHLTLDTWTSRNLFSKNYELCDYTLDASTKTVTSLSNCTTCSANVKLPPNKMLLLIGYGKVTTVKFTNAKGKTFTNSLFINDYAMRQLGFIDFFDLY